MIDLIRKSDADAAIVKCKGNGATRQACRDAIAALPAVAAPNLKRIGTGLYETQPAPDPAPHVNKTLKAEHDADNTLTDPAAIREALLSLPAVYAHQINTGVREVYDPLQRFYTMESVLAAITEATK